MTLATDIKPLESQTLIVIEIKWIGATKYNFGRLRLKNTYSGKKKIISNDDSFDKMADQVIDYLDLWGIKPIGCSKENDQGIVLVVLSWDEKDKLKELGLM